MPSIFHARRPPGMAPSLARTSPGKITSVSSQGQLVWPSVKRFPGGIVTVRGSKSWLLLLICPQLHPSPYLRRLLPCTAAFSRLSATALRNRSLQPTTELSLHLLYGMLWETSRPACLSSSKPVQSPRPRGSP